MERTEQLEGVTIRYAETDQDVVAIHQFLLIVGKPRMRVPVDGYASLEEIIRVVRDEVGIMAIKDGHLIGSLGLIQVPWWYNPAYSFFTERWDFVLPQFHNTGVGEMLYAEADSIALAAECEFINQGKIRGKRGRLMWMPRSSRPESSTIIDQQRA